MPKRHPTGTCIVCDLNRLDEKKPATWTCPTCGRVCFSQDELKAHALLHIECSPDQHSRYERGWEHGAMTPDETPTLPVVPGEGDTYRDASTGTEYRFTDGAWMQQPERRDDSDA